MSESAYKPTEAYEDELDQLACSIREELRLAGFAPAFDPVPDEIAQARRAGELLRKRRAMALRVIANYVGPALVVIGVSVVLRVLVPGF
ncbi:hypothetical protein Q4F19_14030 [Sphingomonas sp. BIUV-7]|uniref:Uncharacterized protein n=1 Tax=Sphingomonas natans TaxID=3063330 RepID=A0ABT8YAZ3_9SPHN|nr:hypothetical protein [Sphingomonas sp. BIUV-7]MDO6415507.1 hypothetical protein [Sphingomonas sp. BIUV-7]